MHLQKFFDLKPANGQAAGGEGAIGGQLGPVLP
jgi:hypothetical protein